MTRQNIATGTTANDGTGDTLRAAANKINDNFLELYQHLGGDSNTLSTQISLEDSAIVFEGASTDAFETRLAASDVKADTLIRLPDSAGILITDIATQSMSNKTITTSTLTNAKISGSLLGTAGTELIKFTDAGAGAVNEVTITNASTSNDVEISATGGDTNINLNINSKGSGSVELRKAAYTSVEQTSNGIASAAATYIICNKGSALAISLADGTTIGEYKIFTNKGIGVATITPSNFAGATSFAISQTEGAQCIWDGVNWFLVGNHSVTTIV